MVEVFQIQPNTPGGTGTGHLVHGLTGLAVALGITVLFALSARIAWALDDLKFSPDSDPIASDFDLSRRGGFRNLTGSNEQLAYKHQAIAELQTDRNENLDAADQENRNTLLFEYDNSARYRYSERLQYFGRLDLTWEQASRQDRSRQTNFAADLKLLYAQWLLPARTASVSLGRQQLKDRREWLFDEEFDGIGYAWAQQSQGAVAFAGREQLFTKDLAGEHEKDKQAVYYIRYYRVLGDRRQGSLYGLYVDDRGFGDDERALFLGARSFGRWSSGLDYWTEAAYVFGRQQQRSHRGYGFDIGLTREFKSLSARPTLTVGFAYGSGSRDGQRVTGFRQTGVQGNSFKLGGVASVDRYGHAFEPELSNLIVTTLGVGLRPVRHWSVDFLLHRYWQVTPSDEIRNSNFDADPNGINRSLGTGFDVVLGLRNWKNLSIEGVIGVFFPGSAFDSQAGSARHAELLFKWKLP